MAERLQRRITAASSERRPNGQTTSPTSSQKKRESSRVLPPMPAELREERSTPNGSSNGASGPAPAPVPAPPAAVAEPTQRTAPVPDSSVPEPTVQVPVGRKGAATARRTPAAPARAPRRARLRLSRIDPWSVMKVSFLLSIAFGIVTVVSVFLVWSVLSAAGVWTSINNTVSDTVSSGNNVSSFDIRDYLGMSRVLGFTMLVSVVDVILITAVATLGAFLYNMAASLLGGIEVTLSEDS
ncbi:MAG: DUF3566 domain-containing protein [Nocardioides sp.]